MRAAMMILMVAALEAAPLTAGVGGDE